MFDASAIHFDSEAANEAEALTQPALDAALHTALRDGRGKDAYVLIAELARRHDLRHAA